MSIRNQVGLIARTVGHAYPFMNLGGCGVFAAALTEELMRRGIAARIRICQYNPAVTTVDTALKNLNHNVNSIWELGAEGLPIEHAIVEFVDESGMHFYVDTHYGIVPAREKFGQFYYVAKGEFPLDLMRRLADTAHGWNNTFDRREIPKVRNMITRLAHAHLQ